MLNMEFDITCFITDKTKLINYVKNFVYSLNGSIKYVESGLISKHINFYISADKKYKIKLLEMYNTLKNIC